MKRTLAYILVIMLLAQTAVVVTYEKRLNDLKAINASLEGRLANLEPLTPRVIAAPKPIAFPYPARKVMDEGTSITFRTLEINDKWQRPLYIPLWHSTSWKCERFSYLPRLVENNRHRVFIYRGGGSYWFDLSPAMGFTDDTSPMGIAFKTGDEAALIALEARITKVTKLGDQLLIVIKPEEKGYHIAAISNQVLDESICQVVTPEGYALEVLKTATSRPRTSNNQ